MTREEAIAVLGVGTEASLADVERRYQELHTDLQIRLTNAPTPALKKTYQSNLHGLQAACELLAPGVLGRVPDLPASEPVGTGALRQTAGTAARPRVAVATPPAVKGPVASQTGPSPMAAFVTAAVCAGLATLLAILWFEARQARDAAVAHAAADRARMQQIEAASGALGGLLQAGPLDVCNRSRNSVKVLTVAASYLDSSGKMRSVHSGSYGYPTWEIRPGERARLQIVRGRDDDWNGTAAAYALQVGYPNVEPFLVAGFWSTSTKDGCVNLYLD